MRNQTAADSRIARSQAGGEADKDGQQAVQVIWACLKVTIGES